MIIVCWNNFIYSWFSQKGILQEQGFISALLHALRNFVLFSYKLACRTGVIFFAYFWPTEAKSRRAPNVSCARGKERKIFFFAPLLTRDSRFAFYHLARDSRFNFRLDFRFPVSPMNRNRSDDYSEKINFVEQSTSKPKCCAPGKISQLSALG